MRRKEEDEEEEGEEVGEDQNKVWNQVYFDFYGFPWRLVAPFLGFCGRDCPNPRFVEVMWVKPQLVKTKHGILLFIWFCRNRWTLG